MEKGASGSCASKVSAFSFGDKLNACNASFVSKMQKTIGVRVDDELLKVVLRLADEEHRTPAATLRKLALEALKTRGLWPPKNGAPNPRD